MGQQYAAPFHRINLMTTLKMPYLTMTFLITMTGLYFLVPDQALLYFNAAKIANGETWRILTGHFMHSDPDHLLWNGAGLAVLGTLIEHRSRKLLLSALAAGLISVNILLMSPLTQLEYYCGLSGVLNTLLPVAIWLEWQVTRSPLIIAVACGCMVKLILEVSTGVSLLTHISWPPYAWSHLAGLAGGLAILNTLTRRVV